MDSATTPRATLADVAAGTAGVADSRIGATCYCVAPPERQCQAQVGAPFGAGVFGARLQAIFIAASPIVSGSG